MKKICIIGLGNMGRAMLSLLNDRGEFDAKGCDKNDDINNTTKEADIVIIAVKPQSFREVCDVINIDLKNKLIISIMAGVSVEKIKNELEVDKVVRVMPNLPLKVGRGFSGWYCNSDVSDDEKELVRGILQTFGEEIEVDTEEKIDQITALSGSGPAYFYFLAELIEKAAVDYGFSQEEAKKIAKNTYVGSAELFAKENISPEELRAKITSKGGTTQAALEYLQNNGFDKIFSGGIDAAKKRAKELNN